MDKLGRRSLMLGGLLLMTLSYVGVGLSQYMNAYHPAGWTSPVSLLTLVTFIISFAVGPGNNTGSLNRLTVPSVVSGHKHCTVPIRDSAIFE